MKKIILMLAVLAFYNASMAQMKTVQLNAKKLQFNDGGVLPAEQSFIINADATGNVAMMKMQLNRGNAETGKVLYESTWRRKADDKSTVVILPNHYKLRSGNEYNFRFMYYRSLQETERKQIRTSLETTALNLLQSNIKPKSDGYKFASNVSEMFALLNSVVTDGMVNFETGKAGNPPVFSDVVQNMLRGMTKSKIESDSLGNVQVDAFSSLIKQVNNEIGLIANNYQYVLSETVIVPDYPVEKKENVLALNLGYGGIYKNGGANDLEYFSAPYAGISFPLGNRVFAGNFWNNASLSVGVFLKDFKISDSLKTTGPVVNKPLYVALGYKVFHYLKLHAGAAVLEERNSTLNTKSVYLKPFVGLSLEINLWLGMDKK